MIEIHYKPFRFINGLLYKKEPLIIFDVPKFIYNKKDFPVILNIKTADKFPIYIYNIKINYLINSVTYSKDIVMDRKIDEYHYSHIFSVELNEVLHKDNITIDVFPTVYYELGNKKVATTLSNISTIKKESLSCYCIQTSYIPDSQINRETIDFHTHTSFTNDFVEFGAKFKDYIQLKDYTGLTKFVSTDHSYDLDDKENEYYAPDETLAKWNKLQKLSDTYKDDVIVGEELSCGNKRNKNIHLLLLKNRTFIPGSGDGGEKLFFNKPTIMLKDVKESDHNDNSILIAAHPFVKSSFFEDLLLNRGIYSNEDLQGLEFIQIINGNGWINYQKDIEWYIKRWQNSEETYFLAGNDSHGYFGWSPKLYIPLIRASYNDENLFGQCKTICNSFSSDTAIFKESLKKSSITTGPYLFVSKIGPYSYSVIAKSFEHFGKFVKITKISFNNDMIYREEIALNQMCIDTTYENSKYENTIFIIITEFGEISFSNVIK